MTCARVAVVLINWNHGQDLKACLEALFSQEPSDFEVIVVDNHSTDGSPEWIASQYPSVRLICNPVNLGFSKAFNQAVAHTCAPFILSLNPDVTVRAGFLAALLSAMEDGEHIGTAAPRLLQAQHSERIDSTGLFVDRCRRPFDRGQGQLDAGQYDAQTHVFGACGGAAFYRRKMLEDLAADGAYMDEQFFAYIEDADLAWRARLRGWQAVFVPGAVALHRRGGGDRLRQRQGIGPRLALRNRYLMVLKNDSLRFFLSDLPWIIAAELPRFFYTALVSPKTLLGWLDLIRALPEGLSKRRQIRRAKQAADQDLRRWFLIPRNS